MLIVLLVFGHKSKYLAYYFALMIALHEKIYCWCTTFHGRQSTHCQDTLNQNCQPAGLLFLKQRMSWATFSAKKSSRHQAILRIMWKFCPDDDARGQFWRKELKYPPWISTAIGSQSGDLSFNNWSNVCNVTKIMGQSKLFSSEHLQVCLSWQNQVFLMRPWYVFCLVCGDPIRYFKTKHDLVLILTRRFLYLNLTRP